MANSKGKTNISRALEELLGGFDGRTKEVLTKRYGLDGREPETLAAIGERYRITRERVRQIEAVALSQAKKAILAGPLGELAEAAVKRLGAVQGVRRADLLTHDLAEAQGDIKNSSAFGNLVHFVLEASGKASYRPEDDEWHAYWHLASSHRGALEALVRKAHHALSSGRAAAVAGKAEAIFANAAKSVPAALAMEQVMISKEFTRGRFGDFGLASWPEINPKTARDWAYLVLKKEKKPLHFTTLADVIARHRTGKKTNFQTVHNELIKDDRFVLVGRGTYGLREFGILPGTAKEVIAHFLKKHGPLKADEVVKKVLDERPFKKNTILINLHSKKHFACLPDGRYCLREA